MNISVSEIVLKVFIFYVWKYASFENTFIATCGSPILISYWNKTIDIVPKLESYK